MSVIILEGVTGAGKTKTLKALSQHRGFAALLGSGRVFDEDETFGEVMTEMREPGISNDRLFRRLERVLHLLEKCVGSTPKNTGFVLERFHLSYYVLQTDWRLFSAFDERLVRLKCLTVLLHIPEQDIAHRCLDREDRSDTTWTDDMTTHFGSRSAALDAIILSTHRRREAAQLSRLPRLEIDTGSKHWEAYADQIVEAWSTMQ